AARGARFVCGIHALGFYSGSGRKGPRASGFDGFLSARRERRGGFAAPFETGRLPRGQLALRHLSAKYQEFSAEYASGSDAHVRIQRKILDRKSTRLNSSHLVISYAVFCLKKKIVLYLSIPHNPPLRL